MGNVSVIIPVYNRNNSLKDAVESVLLQTHKPSEIIIIDDGSFVSAKKILKNYLDKVRVITLDKNSGVSAARNRGIMESSGEYISFLDSDDIFLPKKLEYQLKYMVDNKYDISHTNEFWFRVDKFVNQNKNSARYGGDILSKIVDKCRISPSSLIVKKSVFDKCGFFNEDLKVCEDYDISLRFALYYKVGYLDKKLIIKRAIEDNSLSAAIKHIEYIRYNILKEFYNTYEYNIDKKDKNSIIKEISRKESIVKSDFL